MSFKSCFVNISALQTVPPSCINRDDLGNPKTASFGGVLRARVSSQCWKHAMRQVFDPEQRGVRSLDAIRAIAAELDVRDGRTLDEDGNPSAESLDLAAAVLELIGVKLGDGDKTATLFFYEPGQLESAVDIILNARSENPDDIALMVTEYCQNKGAKKKAKSAVNATVKKVLKKKLETAFKKCGAAAILLFGRMIAGEDEMRVDASCQVAHAISTHRVAPEQDYYIASDDHGGQAAGFIDSASFLSATLYRYANVNAVDLKDQCNGNADSAIAIIGELLRAFIVAMPTGKQNAFGAHTLPYFIMITEDAAPTSYATAFEKPVKANENGYEAVSRDALVKYKAALETMYRPARKTWCIALDPEMLEGVNAESGNVDEIIESVCNYLKEVL